MCTKLIFVGCQKNRAVGSDAFAESDLVIVNVLAERRRARHDDRHLAERGGQHDRARPTVADDHTSILHQRLHVGVAEVGAVLGALRCLRRTGLHHAAGAGAAVEREPGVDPIGHAVERMHIGADGRKDQR